MCVCMYVFLAVLNTIRLNTSFLKHIFCYILQQGNQMFEITWNHCARQIATNADGDVQVD